MTVLRVVVADDEPEVRSALVDLFAADPAVAVVGVAADTEEVVSMAALHRPDVVLMDFKMPNGGGAIATRLIRQRRPETRVVALSAYQDRATVLEMLGAGAVGYITKGSPAADITTAIRRAGEGLAVLSPAASAEVVSELGSRLRDDEQRTAHTRERVQRVQDAIDGNLRTEFQPIVDLACGAVVGVEALARFPGDPTRGPATWLAEASEVGLRVPLERAALELALAATDGLDDGLFLAVNISPDVLVAPGALDGLSADMARRLVVEVTEHAAVRDYDHLRRVLAPLRAQGTRLAVDDAGEGFASFRHILLLEPDLIKIDASLTQDLVEHRGRRALVSALTAFAAETGATVVAEGIERVEDLKTLRAVGAALGQGYLLGRPAPLGDLDLAPRRLLARGPFAEPDVPQKARAKPPAVLEMAAATAGGDAAVSAGRAAARLRRG